MKANTSLCIALCGGMLAGCSSLSDGSLSGWNTPPKIAMTADGEYQRGRQLHLMGQYSDAQKAYLSALAIDPDHADAKNGMAALIGASGDLDRAIGMLVELSERHPASHVYANLGHAYQMRGRDFDAFNAYQRAVELDGANQHARRRLQALEQKLAANVAAPPAPAAVPLEEPAPAAAIDTVTSGVYALRYPPGPSAVPVPAIEERVSPPVVVGEPQVAINQPTPMHPDPVTPARIPAYAMPVELVNGNGVNGFARGLRELLPSDAWRVVRTTNHEQFNVGRTRIEYVRDHAPVAKQFGDELGVNPRLRINNQQYGTRLRVILGHDCKDLQALRLRLAAGQRQAAS